MELFDVLDENGNFTGTKKERSAVHTDGDWHGSVHIWIVQDNKVLLQKRCKDKDSFPLCFDAACTGHIDSGENSLSAAIREIGEEIGLKIKSDELIFLFRQKLCIHHDKFISNEFNDVYLINRRVENSELSFQQEEIDELVWIDINTLSEKLRNGDKNYCIKYEEFKKVLEMIL
ncbi:MAG: NUDIX domain-containing protein [Clostridia bacterium]|nr:NUDIX domain-containing protein [Clostridia bacterium]